MTYNVFPCAVTVLAPVLRELYSDFSFIFIAIYFKTTMSQSVDRLRQLEEIEKDIVKVIRSAGETLEELSKEAPSEDRINATATKFLKSLEGVEKGLSEQIGYLTQVATGQPHEGSTYGAEKDFELLRCRTKSVKNQLVVIRDQGTNTASQS